MSKLVGLNNCGVVAHKVTSRPSATSNSSEGICSARIGLLRQKKNNMKYERIDCCGFIIL
jgi:hypothetical protein